MCVCVCVVGGGGGRGGTLQIVSSLSPCPEMTQCSTGFTVCYPPNPVPSPPTPPPPSPPPPPTLPYSPSKLLPNAILSRARAQSSRRSPHTLFLFVAADHGHGLNTAADRVREVAHPDLSLRAGRSNDAVGRHQSSSTSSPHPATPPPPPHHPHQPPPLPHSLTPLSELHPSPPPPPHTHPTFRPKLLNYHYRNRLLSLPQRLKRQKVCRAGHDEKDAATGA